MVSLRLILKGGGLSCLITAMLCSMVVRSGATFTVQYALKIMKNARATQGGMRNRKNRFQAYIRRGGQNWYTTSAVPSIWDVCFDFMPIHPNLLSWENTMQSSLRCYKHVHRYHRCHVTAPSDSFSIHFSDTQLSTITFEITVKSFND